ncbi:hypothetical protein H0I54_03975 [Yersinia kristensenii]|uniref:hypothetical protein n=1 Tax=Yersinia kristensenii TaxID=28152 RepID=UPI001C60EA6B|nr:hypothetical protein [Yersinia kristensenii]MBW5814593.1 hypothetical protein [Yersinia kristensenii]MBW5831761.1 hypothetical protein [Yersinia kristensenii]MBW5840969.1 hypothetical protein [Yersinia kristensenii]
MTYPLLNFHLRANPDSAKRETERILLTTPTSTNPIAEPAFLLAKKSLFLSMSKGRNVCFNVIIKDLITISQSRGKEVEITGESIVE